MVGFIVNGSNQLGTRRRIPADLFTTQTRRGSLDRRQWCAQLVGYGRQDGGLQPIALFEDSCTRFGLREPGTFQCQCTLACERLEQALLARRYGWRNPPKPDLANGATRCLDGDNQ